MSFQLSIVTPAGPAFEGAVDFISAPGLMGGFQVYSNHMPMVAALKDGQAIVNQGGKSTAYKIDSGVLEVKPNHDVLVLVDQATPA